MVCVRVLGSFTAERDGEPVPLGGRRQRTLLALLVAARGQVVPLDRIVEDLWQGRPPAQAITSLQAYVSNLRRLLEPGRAPRTPAKLLISAPPGYALRLPDGAVDAWRFDRLLREGRDLLTARPVAARDLLREALALWQGPAYAEVADEPWAGPEVARLDELRLVARELHIAAQLRCPDPVGATVPEAELLTRQAPLREEGWRLHALALWADGRQADALATLRRARSALAEEVGIDPGPALTALEQALLSQDLNALREATGAPTQGDDTLAQPQPQPQQDAVEGSVGAQTAFDTQGDGLGATPFLGRDAELTLLAGAARQAGTQGPSIALVTGEAGLGKTALLEQFGRRLRDEGWLVAAGTATDAEGAPPAWAWTQALQAVAEVLPPPPDTADVLAPLLSERASAAAPGADAAAGRFRLRRAVWAWLAAAARQRPVAVLLDDLHWADAQTLALLSGMGELPGGTRLVAVGAYRPDETEGPLGETLAALARQAPLRVPLQGLGDGAVAELVGAVCGAEVDTPTVAALAERTAGNPFYLRESARLLASEGALVALGEVPEGVRDVLRRRLGRLPDATVAVLRIAAVAGREADVEVLTGAADSGEDTVLDALESGLIAGLLTEPAPGHVRFVHALVRDTLLADLSRLRATRTHGRIAASMERLGRDDVSALAHHYAHAASTATAAKAVHYCVRAAALAESRYAHDTAADLLGQALERFEHTPADAYEDRDAERIDLLGRLLRAQVRAGAITAARATRQEAIDRAAAATRDDLLIRAFTAWTEPTPWQTRRYGTVDEPLVAALERLLTRPDLEPAVRCRLLDAYSAELSNTQDARVRAAADEALTLARGLGDPALEALALATLARELDVDRETRQVADLSAELHRLGTAHDLPIHSWFGLFQQAGAAAVEGDVAATRRLAGQSLSLARAYRMPGPLAVSECALATLALIEGRYDDAERLYTRASVQMAAQGSPHADGYLVIAVAAVRLAQGRLAAFVPRAREVFRDYGPLVADVLAAALADAGQHEEAGRVLAEAAPLRPDFFFTAFATFRVRTMAALGLREGAEELYAALSPYRDAPPLTAGFTVAIPPVAHTLGHLARLLNRDRDAAADFAHANTIAERWNSPMGRTS
ncbi:BTAD domain-containing putative transcriptional regulator [Streptomyces sp. NPDC002855]|uniref:BTAD domain-containing putative transcriptional regulator n=1 Tax=Streptomyces sp. NPDC002855 TaxID=3154437 RepID=UPI00333440B3